jgi:hypothetical protein
MVYPCIYRLSTSGRPPAGLVGVPDVRAESCIYHDMPDMPVEGLHIRHISHIGHVYRDGLGPPTGTQARDSLTRDSDVLVVP